MARFFKKLYTHVKETIEDDFIDPFDDKKVGQNVSLKIKSTLKTESGALVKAEGSTHPNGNDVEGTLEPEFKFSDYDVTVKGKFQTNNTFEGSVLFNNYLVKGSTFFVTDKLSDKGEKSVEAGVDYLSKEHGSLNIKVISPLDFNAEKVDLYAAFVGYYKGYSLGVDSKLNIHSFKPSACNGYLEFVHDDLSLALFAKYEHKKDTEKKTIGVGYHQHINDHIRSSVDYSFERVSSTSLLRFGSSIKFDENSSLKSRITLKGKKDMRLGFVLKQNLFPSTRLTFTTDLNARLLLDQEGEGTGHQFGVALSFFD